MELLNKSDSEILDIVTPIAKIMIEAWSNDDYDNFIKYFIEQNRKSLDLESFQTQRSWISELGDYSLNKLVTLHKNPSNIVIVWKIAFANRSELGIGVYRFKEENNQVKTQSCIYFQ